MRVHDGERHAQVALHTDGRQQQSAVVYGGVEQEVGERAQEIVQLPGHVVQGLLHLEGQEGEEDEVRDGEAEEEHVDGRGLAADLAGEGVEGQDVGGHAHRQGDCVDGDYQVVNVHSDIVIGHRFLDEHLSKMKTLREAIWIGDSASRLF